MIETARLTIVDRQLKDIPIEEFYVRAYPEIRELDPPVGESKDPVYFSVFTKRTNAHIGSSCLYNLTDDGIELGVRIFIPEYWNKGYGSEIVNGLCFFAFSMYPQITAIFAKTPVYNTRAMKCYEKCGFIEHSQAVVGGYEMVYMVKCKEQADRKQE